eukprot:15919-Heterococcus_DN1.PRE.2
MQTPARTLHKCAANEHNARLPVTSFAYSVKACPVLFTFRCFSNQIAVNTMGSKAYKGLGLVDATLGAACKRSINVRR